MTCPICGADTAKTYRPFCSRRCADRDLARWMNGSYAIASSDPDDLEEAADAMEDALSRGDPDAPPIRH